METVVFGRVMLINEARFNGDRRTYILHVARHADLMQTRSPEHTESCNTTCQGRQVRWFGLDGNLTS
jgi:hypothetical protein